MPQSSLPASERARKNHTTILRGLASVGQARVAEGMGTSEATISRWKDQQAEQCAKTLALMGLKVVPQEMRCFDKDQISAILTLAKTHMKQLIGPDSLEWEDE